MVVELAQRRLRSVRAAALAGVLLLSACADGGGADYAAAVERWEGSGLQDYRFTWERTAMIGRTRAVVEVRDGKVVNTRMLHDDLEMARATVPTTVEDVFRDVRLAQREADKVEATYNADLGYPREVRVDAISRAIDDEYEFRILSPVALSESSG